MPKLNFRTDWTTPYATSWKNALRDLSSKPDLSYLEVGVWEGRSLIWMFENILTHTTSRAVAIDQVLQTRLVQNLASADLTSRVELIESSAAKALRTLEPNSFDLIYLDASHLAKPVLQDAVNCWELLKEDGILIFDDYLFGEEFNVPLDLKPKMALDAFVTAYGNALEILHRDYQLIVRKIAPLPASERMDQCSRFGDFFYSWNLYGHHYRNEGHTPLGLFRLHGRQRTQVPLSKEEDEKIRELLRGKKFGMPTALEREAARALPIHAALEQRFLTLVRSENSNEGRS